MPNPTDPRVESAIKAGMTIAHGVLEKERELDALKWFEYRFLSPREATMRFYSAYLEARRDFVHTNIDASLKLREKPFSLLEPKELTQVWKARQRADGEGLSYEFYIGFSMWFWGRRSGPGRQRAPQINQLHFTEASEIAWDAEMQKVAPGEVARLAPRLAEVPELRASAFVGAPGQVDMRELIALLSQESSGSWEVAVRKWCYDFPVMSPLSMRRLVPRSMWSGISGNLRRDRPVVSPVANSRSVDLRPSCFAIPKARSPSATCAACALTSSCEIASRAVVEAIRSRTGFTDPRRAALRESANERQRAYEARKKASAAVSAAAP